MENQTRHTLPELKCEKRWKLIRPDEAKEGDQWLDERYNWQTINHAPEDGFLRHLEHQGLMVRREMTANEVNADMLAALVRMFYDMCEASKEAAHE